MAYIVTFDSVELVNPKIFDIDRNLVVNQTILLSGKWSVQMSTKTALAVTFKCSTEMYSNLFDLKDKFGLKKTLTIDGTNYTKCVINRFKEREWYPGKWEYEVGFVQDTT